MGTLLNHFILRERIAHLERDDEERKNTIEKSVYQLVANSKLTKSKQARSKTHSDDIVELKSKLNDYELYLNKLKQEHSTKLKLSDAKHDSAKAEIAKLKDQVKKHNMNIQVKSTKFSLIALSSPNGKLSPISEDLSDVLTPVKNNKRKLLVRKEKAPLRSLKSFERSPNSNSPSPEFTPSRNLGFEFLPPNSSKKLKEKLKSTNPKPKVKKISLLSNKFNKGKTLGTADKLWNNLGLDDENVNSLNYYQDGNFLNAEDSPPKAIRQSNGSAHTPAFQLKKPDKKRKNIFTID